MPPILKLYGDREACLVHLSYANSLLNTLKAKMEGSGVAQDRMFGYPSDTVQVIAEKRFNTERIFIATGAEDKRKFREIMRYYWYHIMTGGYRWYINDLCVNDRMEIFIVGGHALTNPTIWFGDYSFIARYTPDGHPIYNKQWSEDTDYSFGQSICAGEPGYNYVLLEWARNSAIGLYETMLAKLNNAGEIIWDIGFGDTSDSTQVYATNVQHYHEIIAEERHDYVVAAGYFKDFSPVSGTTIKMVYVVKTDENGVVQWKRFIRFPFASSPGWIHTNDMDIDGDGNIYLLVRTEDDGISVWLGDFSIIKLNSSGVFQWAKSYDPTVRTGDIFTAAHEIVADNYGNVYVIMLEKERTSATNGYLKSVLIKVNTSGILQWAKKYHVNYSNNVDPHFDVYPRLGEGRNGDIYLLSQALDNSIEQDDDYILSKFNSDGERIWVEQLHGQDGVDEFDAEIPWGVNIGGMAIDVAGDVILGGDVYSQDRSFVMKLPDGPITGTFHNFDFSIPDLTISDHGIDVDDEVTLIDEDATDLDLITVAYTTAALDTDTRVLYKFLEETKTVEVYDG